MAHTLLLADDSVTIQRLVELTFAGEDISVVAFGNGNHAIASLRHSRPDIVLADVGMPGRSGYDVARHIKGTPEFSHIPVLLLTGAFEPVDEVKAREAGCDGVLSKPFEPRFVVARVKELLAGVKRAPDEPPLAVVSRPPAAAALDDYFERLDRAIATRVADAVAPPHPVPPEPRPGGPVLAHAFSALLAAERTGSSPVGIPGWASDAPQEEGPVDAAVIEEVIEEVTRRVLARLADTVVRDAVADIASSTAERLVGEEIERIKRNIK